MTTEVMHRSLEDGNDGVVPPTANEVAKTEYLDEPSLIGMTLLGRYHILSKIGEGGMGTVYLAEHTAIRKKFAIKVLGRDFVKKSDLVERFLQEARAASMIAQENVVEITDFGDAPYGSVFFVMEYLQGEDLARTIKTCGRLDWPRVKSIMLQICSALEAAHEVGIIHRDMKPENCFRIARAQNEDFIKVLDFGIAKIIGDDSDTSRGLTRTGMIFGTPEYMSPEQAQGQKPDHRVDIYAAGVIMFELLTGRVPFLGDTFMGILTKHMFEAAPWPSNVAPDANIPADVESVVLKALEKEPASRFSDMQEMAAAIRQAGTEEPVRSPRPKRNHIVSSSYLPTQKSTMQTELTSIGHSGGSAYDLNRSGFLSPKLLAAAAVVGLSIFGLGLWASGLLSVNRDEESGSIQQQGRIKHTELRPANLGVLQNRIDDETSFSPPTERRVTGDGGRGSRADGHRKTSLDGTVQADVVDNDVAEMGQVNIQISTPREAKIIDLINGEVLGVTNSSSGIVLNKTEEFAQLELRAEGYRPLKISIRPFQDGKFDYSLEKEKKTKHNSRRRIKQQRPVAESTPSSANKLSELKPPSGIDPSKSQGESRSDSKSSTAKIEGDVRKKSDGKKKWPKVNSPDLINPFGPK